VGPDKGRSQLQLAQFFAALGLAYLQDKDNAERANVEKQHSSIRHEPGMKTTGAATLGTALAVERGLGSLLRHTRDSSYALNTNHAVCKQLFHLSPVAMLTREVVRTNSGKEKVEIYKRQKHLNSSDFSKA